MADKIDSLKIGSTSYDIDLPPDATPSIASLTTSGAVTANGGTTTNGLVVKNSTGQTATFTVTNAYDNVGSLSLSGVDYLNASNVQATFGTVSCGTAYITQLGDSDMFTYTYLDQNFVFKTNESGESGRGQATYGVKIPNTYGWTANRTLATTNDIPTVNNGTLTIQKNGNNVQTFTANQSGNVTANITVPTKVSELTNDRYVRYDTASQGLNSTQQSNARTNIGAGTSNLTLGSNSSTAAAGNHLYHYWTANAYYMDSYSTGRNFRMVTESVLADTLRWQAGTVANKEYWDYTNNTWVTSNIDFKNFFDGNYSSAVSIPYAQRKFRFTMNASTGWPTDALLCLEGSWWDSGAVSKITGTDCYVILTIETRASDSDAWTTKVTANFTSTCQYNQSLVVPSTALHTGHTRYRITIELGSWEKTANPASLRRLMILSNYAGNPLTPFTYSGEGSVTARNTLYATTIYENGTLLSNKYLGKSAKAADADKLDGNDSTYYLNYNNLTNKPTIPATNVIPATTTANKMLVSTTTSGTAKWSDWSSAGFLKSNTSGVVSIDTNSYYLASNPNGYTSNTGTVTSVSAGTGLSISGTASTTPTVNIASGYKLPTTTEWSGKQNALPTTTTAGKVLKSTSTAGTVEWGDDTNTNQTVKGNGTAFSANDAIDIVGAGTVTVTADTTNKKITITGSAHTTDHNQTVKGNGFAFGADSAVNFVGKDGITVAVDGSVNNQINISGSYPTKTLKTDNTTAQSTSSSEAIAGSGTINLHKVAKTGTYSDLIGKPTIPTTYLASASVSSNTLTLTPASGTATTFTPYNQTVSANGTLFSINRNVDFVGKDGITVAADSSVANQINISGAGVPPEIIDISGGITQAIKNKVTAKPLSFLKDGDGYIYYPSYKDSGIPYCYENFETEALTSKELVIDWENLDIETNTCTYALSSTVQRKAYIHNLTITPTSTSQAKTLYLTWLGPTSSALTKTAILAFVKTSNFQPRVVNCGILNSTNNFYPARLVSASYSGANVTFSILVNGQSSTWSLTLSTVVDDFVQL